MWNPHLVKKKFACSIRDKPECFMIEKVPFGRKLDYIGKNNFLSNFKGLSNYIAVPNLHGNCLLL